MLLPLLLVLAEVALEGLLAPGAVDGVANRGKGRYGPVLAGVAEKLFESVRCFVPTRVKEGETNQSESTVSTHAVTSDADFVGVELRESSKDGLRQLRGDVAVHVIAIVVWGVGGVDVEAGTSSEVIRIVLALDIQTTCK